MDNVVLANLLAVKSDDGFGQAFNVACDSQISLNELLKLLGKIIGVKVDADYKESRLGDVLHSRADISNAKKILKYDPQISIEDGLVKTVDWFKNYA